MAKKPPKFNPGEISDDERYIVAKELIGPLDANKPVILTRQIKQSLLAPMVDSVKTRSFVKLKEYRGNVGTAKA